MKFYTSVAKGFKLKVKRFWGLIPNFVEVTPPILNKANKTKQKSEIKKNAIKLRSTSSKNKLKGPTWKGSTSGKNSKVEHF